MFIVDDHDIVRRGLLDLLASKRDIRVVGESASAQVAKTTAVTLQPDVLLLDLQLQDGTGIEVCRAVRAHNPRIRGLLLTAAPDGDAIEATVLAGAAGHVVKLAHSLDIADAVRTVGAGRSLMNPADVADAQGRILDRVRADPTFDAEATAMLELVVRGMSDREIANRLQIDFDVARSRLGELVGAVQSSSG